MVANRLTQLTLKFVSLVTAGANRRTFVAKADGPEGDFSLEARVVKVDEALKQVTGALYPTGQVDTQGDFVTDADFDAAMADFMAKGRTAAGVACDVMHDERPTGDFIIEAFKLAEGDARFPGEAPGTWIVTRQITDEATWTAVQDGTYKAFSFGGTAVRIPNVEVSKAGDRGEAVKRSVRALLEKGLLSDRMARLEVPHLLDAACGALWDAFYGSPANTQDEKDAVAAVVAELQAELSKESSMDKSLLQKLAEGFAALIESLKGEPELAPVEHVEEPAPAPATKSAEDQVAEAVATAKAEHETAVEALKADFAAQLAEKDEEIARLGKLAPGSGRLDMNGVGDNKVSGGGVFAGRVQ